MNRKKSKRQKRETKRDSKEITTVDKTIADESTKKITRKGRRPKVPPSDDVQEKTQSQKAPETVEASTQQEKRKRDTKVRRQTPNVMLDVEKVVEEFVKYTTETAGVDGLRKECRVVLDFKPKPGTYNKFEASPHLNRYPEIPCLDETRIVLQPSEGCDNDYIHANRVKMDKLDREFILTQGPKSNTVEDFWRMVFQQQCSGVIMLCNFYEDGTQSCEEFWPTDAGGYKYYGKMFVNNKRIDHLDQYDVYTLEVLPDGCSNSILTKLAHCTMWPRKAVPPSGRMVLRLLRWTQSLEPGPVTLLCSAGIGRTGTLVAIDAVCNRLFKGFEGKVKEVALSIRKQRALSIHNELQYFFIYSTVLDYIRAKLPKYNQTVSKFYLELSKV